MSTENSDRKKTWTLTENLELMSKPIATKEKKEETSGIQGVAVF